MLGHCQPGLQLLSLGVSDKAALRSICSRWYFYGRAHIAVGWGYQKPPMRRVVVHMHRGAMSGSNGIFVRDWMDGWNR